MEPESDDPLILPPDALPSDAAPVGMILDDESVVDFAPAPTTRQ